MKIYGKEAAIENMEKIEVTLEICTLYKGVPYGLALIKHFSFTGIGVFNEGKLTGAPFTCLYTGIGLSCSKMENGRPADNSYHT